MKYVCLIHREEAPARRSASTALDRHAADREARFEAFDVAGGLIACEWIADDAGVVLVRVRDRFFSVLDGPPDASRERLAGVCLIEARDLNDAIRIGARVARGAGSILEVHPVRSHDPQAPK